MNLREHLIQSRIAGDVATPRDVNLRNALRRPQGHDPVSAFTTW